MSRHRLTLSSCRDRTDDLLPVQSRYPGGEIHRILAPDQRILALVYDWPGNLP